MARRWNYSCTRCGRRPGITDAEAKDGLVAKTATFKTVGLHGQTLRSRVVDWLCSTCLDLDADYSQPENNLIGKVGHVTRQPV